MEISNECRFQVSYSLRHFADWIQTANEDEIKAIITGLEYEVERLKTGKSHLEQLREKAIQHNLKIK